MAGIAKRVQQSQDTNPRYTAGLREDTFLEDMLWEVSPFRSRVDNDRINHTLPSWSWARSDAPRRYIQNESFTPLCTVEDVHCTPSPTSHDAFIDIQPGAHVTISGFLLPAKSTRYGVCIDKNPRIFYIPRRDYVWAEGENGDGINDGDDIYVLPLAVSESDMNGSKQDVDIHALVLRQSSDNPRSYTRAGIFLTSIRHLSHHEYIFEGTDVLLSALQAQVAYGESILDEDGVYRRPHEEVSEADAKDATNTALPSDGPGSTFKQFDAGVQLRHILLYGTTNPELTMDEFSGLVDLEMLRVQMLAEEKRVAEWRSGGGDMDRARKPGVKRDMIKIV